MNEPLGISGVTSATTPDRGLLSFLWNRIFRMPIAFRAAVQAAISAAIEQRRIFLLMPFCMIAGLVLYRLPGSEPDLRIIFALGLVIAAITILSFVHQRMMHLTTLALAAWVGFTLLPLFGALWGTNMLLGSTYGTFEARVDEVLPSSGTEQRIILSDIHAIAGDDDPALRRARLFVRSGEQINIGDLVAGTMRFAQVPGPVVVGGFDSQFHAFFDGIGAYGNSTGPLRIIARQPMPAFSFQKARDTIGRRLDAAMSQPALGVARALTIGDQSRVGDDLRAIMASAGLAHILAISGLHLTLVAGGVFAGLRILLSFFHELGQRIAIKKMAAIGGIIVALIYLGLSGASVSAIRATIMLLLVFGAVIAGRRALTMRNVAIAALFVLLTDPASVFRPSFQLSFSAVVALIGVYELVRSNDSEAHNLFRKILRFISGIALTSLIAGSATALFAAYHFQQTAPLGVLGNILALPLVGFLVLPSAFLGVLAMPLGFEAPFLHALGWTIDFIISIAQAVAVLSQPISPHPMLNVFALFTGLAALAWFAFFTGKIRFLVPILALPAIFLFGLNPSPDILIADSTQAVAVRQNNGLALISGRTGSFAVNAWQETYGEQIGKHGNAACDTLGCVATLPEGATVSLVKRLDAFAEDCRSTNLVISRLVAPTACALITQIIDQQDLAAHGIHWLRWNSKTSRFDIQRAINDPRRPWRPTFSFQTE